MIVGILIMYVVIWKKIGLHFAHVWETLRGTMIKNSRLINLGEKISRQSNVESVIWLSLGALG